MANKNIGIEVTAPKGKCEDANCAFHGTVKVRGKSFVGTIVKSLMQKTAVVSWERRRYVPKYERYEKVRTRIKVHNPGCISAEKGDKVKIMETRPLSKTKHFIIIEKLGEDFAFQQKEERQEDEEEK
jgi:small subunit ribosomal protein S17